MLRMRSSQIAALRPAEVEDFVERVVAHLHDCVPDLPRRADGTEIRAEIRDIIDEAAGYDIVTERDVSMYIVLRLAFGRIDDHPGAGAILRRNEPAADRIGALCEELIETRDHGQPEGSRS